MIDPVIERQYDDCRMLMELWRKYHDYFKVAVAGTEISPEREHDFITVKSHIAMLHDIFMDCLEHDQNIGQNILSIVTRSITLKHIHRMSTAEIKKIELEWHESYLLLNETIGVLEDRRNKFAEVTPSEYYRKLYTQKAVKATRDFLTGWVFKSIVALIAVMIVIFLCIQFQVLDKLADNPRTRTLVVKFENLLRVGLKDYPYRDITAAYLTRLDRVPPQTRGTIISETAQTEGQYTPERGVDRVRSAMGNDPNNIADDIAQGMDRDTCRTVTMDPGFGTPGERMITWLFRMKASQTAKQIEAKYLVWRGRQQEQPNWEFFRKANVIGVIFGGDMYGGNRNWMKNQYLHVREKKR